MFSKQSKIFSDRPEINEAYKFHSSYRFYFEVDDDAVLITITIEETHDDRFMFTTSHLMHSPIQAGPYSTSRRVFPTPDEALEEALGSITSFYDSAVRAGHTPKASWFVER